MKNETKQEIRIPTQKRSIEKKQKIIDSGFKLICEKGYYNTNTAEIAKEANVSTGIVYQYFKDKKDILLQGIEQYYSTILFHTKELQNKKIDNLRNTLYIMINENIKSHILTEKTHEEIQALRHSDKDVAEIFMKQELITTQNLCNILRYNDINIDYMEEKVHLIINLLEDLTHEIVYHHHENMNLEKMKDIAVDTILFILGK